MIDGACGSGPATGEAGASGYCGSFGDRGGKGLGSGSCGTDVGSKGDGISATSTASVIGDKLTEINVTSPTCVRELEAQFDINICARLFDAIEKRLH